MEVRTLDGDGRARLRRLLAGHVEGEVAAAVDDRELALDLRLWACGARLALDEWHARPWTPALLDRLASRPSPAWQSVLLAADAGVDDAAWVLVHAMDDAARRGLASVGVPALTAIIAAGLGDDVPLPPAIDHDLADLIRATAVLRRELGRVPRPWEDDFGEQPPVTDTVRSMARTLPVRLRAASLPIPDEPEIDDVLRGTVDDDGADWVVYTLDAIAAEVASKLAPQLRGALPPALRDAWAADWSEQARAALVATAIDPPS